MPGLQRNNSIFVVLVMSLSSTHCVKSVFYNKFTSSYTRFPVCTNTQLQLHDFDFSLQIPENPLKGTLLLIVQHISSIRELKM